MGIDYYKILQIKRNSSDSEINKSYRILALKYHPVKNPRDQFAQETFEQLCEAYDVLSDPSKKATYDQYGEEGLKGGVPSGVYKSGAWTDKYVYHGDADKVFREFFGGDNPYQEFYDRVDGDMCMGFGGIKGRGAKKQDTPIERDLVVGLDEVFNGCIKKMKISRRVMNEDGKTTSIKDKILTITIKKGWKEGTRITFPQEGDQGPNNIPADIVFILKDKPNAMFRRDGVNLIYTTPISLCNALVGTILEIKHIDDRTINIPVSDIVCPGYTKCIIGEGMPYTADPVKRGDLIIEFKIEFPKSLSLDKRNLIKVAFL